LARCRCSDRAQARGADRREARLGGNARCWRDIRAGADPTTGCSASRRPSKRPSDAGRRGHAADCSTCSDLRPGGSAANMRAGMKLPSTPVSMADGSCWHDDRSDDVGAGTSHRADRAAPGRRGRRPPWVSGGVASVGAASFFSDTGHEIATAVLPSFLTSVLGVIEGLSDGDRQAGDRHARRRPARHARCRGPPATRSDLARPTRSPAIAASARSRARRSGWSGA
jgi:hypothetical protein